MNWMQRDTLIKFLWQDKRKLKELRPKDVDSNLFSYHLNQLIRDGLVKKSGHGEYQLTTKGKHIAGLLSQKTGHQTKQPKIANMIYARKGDKYLLIKWKRQPFLGLYSLPYGKLHFGRSVHEMIQEELAEKTGLKADLNFKKDIYVKITEQDEILTHMLVHVFEATNISGSLHEGPSGKPVWSTLQNKKFVPGFKELIAEIESDSRDLAEITAQA